MSNKFTLSCDFGVIGSIDYYGVNPLDSRGSCMANSGNDQCKVTNPAFADQFS